MAVSANGLPGVRPLPAEQGPVKFCKQLTKVIPEASGYVFQMRF